MSDRHDELARVAPAAPAFLEVGSLDELPPGAVRHVVAGGNELALVNSHGHVVAIGDICLRCGSPLSTGALSAARLTCARCGWQYDVMQGCVVGLPALRIDRHDVRIADDHLFVAVAAADPSAPTS